VLAVAWRGGYTQAGRGATVILAGAALAVAWRTAPARVQRAGRSAPVLLLAGLAAFGALSAAWTVGAPADALRWALVLAALAALTAAAAALEPPRPHAAILLIVAVAAAAAGIAGAIAHADRIGLDICGSWRPAGPLEYPPALALLCVGALAPALAGALRPGRAQAAAFVVAAWLLAVTAGLSGSRLEVALAAAALAAVAAWMPAAGAAPAVACALVALGATLSALAVGGALGDDGAPALVAAGLCGPLTAGAWLAVRGRIGPRARRAPWLALVCVLGITAVAGSSADERVGGCAYAGLTHGRTGIWRAAVRTARERPLAGHGLESFLTASAAQQRRERAVPVQYAHDLPLEAWVELGVIGALLVLGLYVADARAVLRASRASAVLLGPAVLAFLAANLLDWPWHLAGCGVAWAIAVGGVLAARAYS